MSKPKTKTAKPRSRKVRLPVATGVRAGDLYIQSARGANNSGGG